MPKFYVTYPQRLKTKAKCYSEVDARSFFEAQKFVTSVLGTDWAFLYTTKQFLGDPANIVKYPNQIEAYGLKKIPLTNGVRHAKRNERT